MFSEATHQPNVSVITPAYNASATLTRCLQAIVSCDDASCEYIVIDDGSTDGTERIAQEFAVQVIRLPDGPLGPSHARNRGAEIARGRILFFVDADVVLAPGAIRRVEKVFQEQPDLAAVFGSYDARPHAKRMISQYRNLLHHFVHQNGNPEASTFWAGCGAIQRSVFEEIGGFDAKQFPRPSIEDIELGYRLRRSGYRILLDKTLQGTHLKSWNFSSLIWTDITCRALPWSRLILESKKIPNDLNLNLGQRISLVLVALACALLALAVVVRAELLAGSAAALLGVGVLNRPLYTFFFRQRGILFAAACIPLHFLYYFYSGLSYVYVWIEFQLKRMPRSGPILALKSMTRSPNQKIEKP